MASQTASSSAQYSLANTGTVSQQEQLARSMGEGHRVIHGVARSGKTMILGYRAQYLAQALTNKPILILCFNRALAARLQQMVEERVLSATVSARSFHGWCNDQLRLYHLRRPHAKGVKRARVA